ncbi:hypothetical protein [Streptomyces sparsogenes]|uniref:Uncharacterized protein n=1 Tax=Streptomyces sparsogenes DSM 40356 TaxID=1331668 RepID=A0A1R1S815_9ACTN|nr:hypothetical protein [Streptomyces sparsogenes]OMI34352.1 hypothetical protein SPAR_36251 [Streptomyces sparsogenes DSM 40356]
MTTPKGHCQVCGRPYRLKSDGTVRSHWARNPDGTAAAGLKDCGGVGEPPAEALNRALTEAHTRTVADLGQVLDVEAGLAEILNRSNDNKEKP